MACSVAENGGVKMKIHSKEQLKQDLCALGISAGDTVLMHSSYRSLGGVEDGAEGFFSAFMELLGPEGTLILPALSYESVTRQQPEFHLAFTPSCVGYLPEFFRTQVPGVVRSMHPTHSCCMLGKRAAELAANHELDDTPVGPHSPFAKLPKISGKILMLGCGLDHNTSMHGVEETAEPPYLFDRTQRVDYILYDDAGHKLCQHALRHSFSANGVRCYEQRYSRVVPLLSENEASHGPVLCADSWLLSAAAVWEKGHRKLLEDPFYFVERQLV